MNLKRTFACASFIVILLTFLFNIGTSSAKTIKLRFAQPFSPKDTMQVMLFDPWAKKIDEMTGGRVKVIMYSGGALGKTPDHYALAETGIADISYTLHDYTPGRFPMTSVFELPFMVPSAEKTSTAMWKIFEKYPGFQKEYSNVKLLALFCHPGGHFNTIKKPILTLEDFKGMKFRTANPHVTKALKAFGAIPVSMAVTEAYTALERGVVDGTVLPWDGMHTFKQAELLKYSTEADFYTMTMMVVMNRNSWNTLPDDIKKVIDETTGITMSRDAGKIYDDLNPVMKQHCIDEGVQPLAFKAEDREKLEELTIPLREEWVEEMEAKGLPGRKVLDAALKLINE